MMLRHIILSKGMTREDLEEWHRPRMVALIDGKVSLLALETMPGSIEVLLDVVAILWVILVNMEISVILGHEKTKIQNIID